MQSACRSRARWATVVAGWLLCIGLLLSLFLTWLTTFRYEVMVHIWHVLGWDGVYLCGTDEGDTWTRLCSSAEMLAVGALPLTGYVLLRRASRLGPATMWLLLPTHVALMALLVCFRLRAGHWPGEYLSEWAMMMAASAAGWLIDVGSRMEQTTATTTRLGRRRKQSSRTGDFSNAQ